MRILGQDPPALLLPSPPAPLLPAPPPAQLLPPPPPALPLPSPPALLCSALSRAHTHTHTHTQFQARIRGQIQIRHTKGRKTQFQGRPWQGPRSWALQLRDHPPLLLAQLRLQGHRQHSGSPLLPPQAPPPVLQPQIRSEPQGRPLYAAGAARLVREQSRPKGAQVGHLWLWVVEGAPTSPGCSGTGPSSSAPPTIINMITAPCIMALLTHAIVITAPPSASTAPAPETTMAHHDRLLQGVQAAAAWCPAPVHQLDGPRPVPWPVPWSVRVPCPWPKTWPGPEAQPESRPEAYPDIGGGAATAAAAAAATAATEGPASTAATAAATASEAAPTCPLATAVHDPF